MLTLIVGLLALVALLAVLLMQLGVTREVVVLQERVAVFSKLLLRPPEPSYLHKQLPQQAIVATQLLGSYSQEPFLIVFMKAGCGGCFTLAQEFKEATRLGSLKADAITCFMEPDSIGSKIETLMRDTTQHVAESEEIFQVCEISATPTILIINPKTWEVISHSVGGDAAWAISRLEIARRGQLQASTTPKESQTTAISQA
jgi:thioredoxin-related protein